MIVINKKYRFKFCWSLIKVMPEFAKLLDTAIMIFRPSELLKKINWTTDKSLELIGLTKLSKLFFEYLT